jgi:protein SCO1/2
MRRNQALPMLCVLACLAFSCTSSKPKEVRQYPIEGKVISVDPAKKEITLQHKDIPGYMKGMTMPFRVQDEWVLGVAKPGDELRGTLAVETDRAYIQGVSINQAGTAAAASSTSTLRIPAAGEQAPDFGFVDQSGNRVRLRQFRGRPVLLTFIYTRCPLPDFCIRMSGNFAEVARELKRGNPAVYAKLQLLSISIDPEYDQPAVLKRYGKAYAGEIDPKFEHWKFVSGTPEETRRAAEFFGLTYVRDNGQIVHSLRTVLLAPDGSIAAQFPGNEWRPADVESELQKLVKTAAISSQHSQHRVE